LNDGLYGNSYSWISANGIGGASDPDPFAGLSFSGIISITNIAWSRDNGDNAEFLGTDRALGTYMIQVTMAPSPDATTLQNGDPATGWDTVGTVQYRGANPPDFAPYLRHRFEISRGGMPIEATGMRIKVSSGQMALDEIEVNTPATRPQPALRLARGGSTVVITWSYGGGLESAPSITGPWTCVPDALPSGYTVPLDSATARFYRARR
jgi:hypothetical protein